MASPISPRVIVTRPYRATGFNLHEEILSIGNKSTDICLSSASIRSKSSALTPTLSSPSSSFYESYEFSRNAKVEPVSPTSCLFSSLTNEAQRVPSLPLSPPADTVASDAPKMESPDWPLQPGDLFDQFPALNNVVNIFDRPAVSPDRHAQLETPQPQFTAEPQQWAFPAVNEPSSAPLHSSSDDLLSLESLTSEEVDRLLSETTDQSVDPQVVAEQHVCVLEEGRPLDVLHAVSHDHDYVEQPDWKILAEFLHTTEGLDQFVQGEFDVQVEMGGETLAHGPTFMDTPVDLMAYMEQSGHDGGETADGVPVAPMDDTAEEMGDDSSAYSPAPSTGSVVGTYRDRRNRNNEASRKSRAIRKAKLEEMKLERAQLESRNHTLLTEVDRLQAIRDEWKDKLLQMMGTR